MDNIQDILKRYYRGETTLAEERYLKEEYRRGHLPEDPALSMKPVKELLPEGLYANIQQGICKRQQKHFRQLYLTAGSIAAMLILIIFIKGSFQPAFQSDLQVTDNMKRERFENALRTIGNILEEDHPNEKVLYEDHKLIIAIE